MPVGTAAEYDIHSLAQFLNSDGVYFQTRAALTTYEPLSYAAAVVQGDPDAHKNDDYNNDDSRAGDQPIRPLVFYGDMTAPNTARVPLDVVGLGQAWFSMRQVNDLGVL